MSIMSCTVGNSEAPAPVTPPVATAPDKSTYTDILKSSALVGGSQLLTICVGIVRTKVMAILLGPAGVGLFGIYNSISDVAQSVGGMGVNSSGVRQIAEAAGSGDADRIGRTAAVLRRTSLLLGTLTAVLLLAFAPPVSRFTFGNRTYAAPVSMLSIVVLCKLVSAGQGALIQGMRRIADLARMGVLGALFGTMISIPLVYFLREKGIVPSLIAVGITSIGTSWWYSRKIDVRVPHVTVSEARREATSLLKLGFAFMASSLMTMGAAYAVRMIVLRKVGVEATGLYQSAWAIGGLYVGFILQAMGADFYPRLTARAHDNSACNRLVNEQARVGLLLAGPGVIGTLTFAPLVIALFYTSRFGAAVDVLRWICLGATLRVITWPMGFIILAKGEQALLFWSEAAWTVFNVSATWLCVGRFGLTGAGIAFCASYLFHGCLIYGIVSRLSRFRWSSENTALGIRFLLPISLLFCCFHLLPRPWTVTLGAGMLAMSAAFSLRTIITLAVAERIPIPFQPLLQRFGLARE